MRKFVASHPDCEVTGYTLLSLKESVTADQYTDILKRYGLDDVVPEEWYKFQPVLDFFRELASDETTSLSHMIAIGKMGAETDLIPEHITDITSMLTGMSETYQLNMRNLEEPEGYKVEVLGDRHIRMTDYTPWPHDMVYGYLYGLVMRFRSKDVRPIVRRTYLNEEDPDAAEAIYEITW